MIRITYTPILDGEAYDPEDNGGAVTQVELFSDPGRTTSVTTAGPATKESTGVYYFIVDLEPGRYWPTVTWQPDSDPDTIVDDYLDPMDAPGAEITGLVVAPEEVAWRVGIELPLTAAQRQLLTSAIIGIQGRVRAYLKRSLIQERRTLTGYAPDPRYEQTDWRAWPEIMRDLDEVFSVVSVTEADGAYTVVVDVGYDFVDDPQTQVVREYIAQGASNALRFNSDTQVGSRQATSISTGDQSVSYAASSGGAQSFGGTFERGSLTAGSTLVLEDLSLFRRRTVYQSDRWVPPYPYTNATPVTYQR